MLKDKNDFDEAQPNVFVLIQLYDSTIKQKCLYFAVAKLLLANLF